jgi:tyrosinase
MRCDTAVPLTPLRAPESPSTALRHRVSVFNLDGAASVALRGAFASLKAMRDSRGLQAWAGIHGWPQFRCQHTNEQGQAKFFLPWHRAFLYEFELELQRQSPQARLCWWDWPESRSGGIPPLYADAEVDGQPNPLLSGPMPENVPERPAGWGPTTRREPEAPASLPDQKAVDAVLAKADYYDFELSLEEQLHDNVHGWVGGDMGVIATAAYDPIFWAHHTMVDRLWSVWQSTHAAPGPPPDTYSTPLGFGTLTIADVLDTKRLGYDYAASVQHTAVAGAGG